MHDAHIHSIARLEFGRDPAGPVLLRRFLKEERYCPPFSEHLTEVAGGRHGASWEMRRAAVLMLENQILRLTADDERECAGVLAAIGVDRRLASVADLRRRMSRLARVHRGIRGGATSVQALGDFLHVARHECKLTLAAHFFSVEETATRVASLLRLSQGLPYWTSRDENSVRDLTEHERDVIEALNCPSCIYWTGDDTPSAINSLIEHPIGTVALAIKLPGSDGEFELKRSGVRGKQPLGVRHYRAAHRLYGGSGGGSTDAEARAALRLADVYRAVHDREPPISISMSISCIQTVPAWAGEASVIPYFTDPKIFGDGYNTMRRAMADAVQAFEGLHPLVLPGPVGLTVRFLRHLPPRQAVLKGTTSFRLESLQTYLSADGPREYFTRGLGRGYSGDDARRFADDLLEEILGVYEPPDAAGPYEDYVRRALTVPANRKRADRLYVEHMREAGMLWGTLVATNGFSRGESCVPRNVGLKSRWRHGQWTVDLVFMDHDTLQIPVNGSFRFDPQTFVTGMGIDEGYLRTGDPGKDESPTVEGCLIRIYRVGNRVQAKGADAFDAAVANAYRKTRQMTTESPAARRLFDRGFLEKMALWESLLWSRLHAKRCRVRHETWTARAEKFMQTAGCGPRVTDEWVRAAARAAKFLDRYADAFDPRYLDLSRSRRQPAG